MNILKERTCTVKIYGEELNYDYQKKEDVAKPVVVSFTFPETYLDFNITDDNGENPSQCILKIYGVSRNTYSMFHGKNFSKWGTQQFVEIYVGYNRVEELAYRGVLSRVKYLFQFGKQCMEMLIDANVKKCVVQRHSICIDRPVNTYEAIVTLCKKFGYNLICKNEGYFKSVQLKNITFNGNLKECLSQVMNSEMSYLIDNDNVIIYSGDKSLSREYKLTFDNGMVAYPVLDTNSAGEEGFYQIKNKIIPSIRIGDVVNIPIGEDGLFSEFDTGSYEQFVVNQYKSSFSPSADSTELECVKKDG